MNETKPEEILELIGEPGKERVLNLAELFSEKPVLKNNDFDKMTYSDLEELSWYYLVDLKRRGERFKVKKGKMFDEVLKLIKDD
ncbi:MAG: hypothetical protein R6U26_00320 [Candidatus Undinarchaeales archaeon]